jgi:hypothetical protein
MWNFCAPCGDKKVNSGNKKVNSGNKKVNSSNIQTVRRHSFEVEWGEGGGVRWMGGGVEELKKDAREWCHNQARTSHSYMHEVRA